MLILALDPAVLCGWTLTPLISGVWDFSIKRDESAGMRLLRLEAKLNEVFQVANDDPEGPLRLVVYEAARHAMPKMQGALVHQAKLQAVIERWASVRGIEYKGYSPTEIKKFATGKGIAKKPEMIAEAKRRYPTVQIIDDNHADSLLLWAMAQHEFGAL